MYTVNNVGMTYEYANMFADAPAERFYQMVHVNCQTVVQMSHTVLPKMLQSGGGYIINLSSGISFTPFPMLMVYSATKKFMNYISDGLRKEYGSKGITVQTVAPLLVSTAMTRNVKSSFFVRTPISYTRAAVATIGIQNTTFGCFPHEIQGLILNLPSFLVDHIYWKRAIAIRNKNLKRRAELKSD